MHQGARFNAPIDAKRSTVIFTLHLCICAVWSGRINVFRSMVRQTQIFLRTRAGHVGMEKDLTLVGTWFPGSCR